MDTRPMSVRDHARGYKEGRKAERKRCAKIADAELLATKDGGAKDDIAVGQIGAASRIAAAIRRPDED